MTTTRYPSITIYTDGACRGNQNDNAPGGYGAVIWDGQSSYELAQGYRNTTNNRMELRAAIAGLKALSEKSTVQLYSDSKYVTDAFNAKWIDGWLARNWVNASKKPVANRDLWEELLSLTRKHLVTWHWVKGHAGHEWNERADKLAVQASYGELLKDDGVTAVRVVQ